MITMRIAAFVLLAIGNAAGASLLSAAPAKSATKRNPFEKDPRAIQAGAKLYARECSACHGVYREGIHAPSLLRPAVTNANPGALFWVLRNGSIYRGMPSFAHIPEAQRWQIISFLQTGNVNTK